MRIAMLLHKSVEFDSRVRREASALAAVGHEVVVIELAMVPEGDLMLDGFRRRSCLPPEWIRRGLPGPVYRSLMVLCFVGAIVRVRPQVVHAHDAAMLVPGLAGAWLTGAQLVYDSHELATSVPYRERAWAWLVAGIERAVVPRCAAVITVSDGIATRLRARYRLPVSPTVVRNVTALQVHGAGGLRRRLGLGPDAPLILHQGAPAPARGCELLLEAAMLLEGVNFVFLGNPEPGYAEHLSAIIRRRGLAGRVSLLSSIALDELLAHTAEADVGVTLLQDTCENHRLALPNKLFEYIAAGLPVVASALPETARLVEGYGIGWCVPPGRPEELAAALNDALSHRRDPALQVRLAQAAEQLTWSREQGRLIELYTDLGSRFSANAPDRSALVD
jgi:glycosyltransferase involved in cell wall biosynthesis